MTVTAASRPSLPSGPASRRWGWPQFLALIGLPILIWETWTVVAWLADGPVQITQYRDPHSASWYAAHTFEAAVLLVSLVVLVIVVRDCRRQGRILTFDVMFCLCGATLFWGDALTNFYVPMWLPSSNFVNLNYVAGHMPFVSNPDLGRLPDPILFTFFLETFCVLGLAMVFGRAVERVRARWPHLSTRQLFALVLATGILVDFVLEILVMLPLHLWTYAAPEALTFNMGEGARIPAFEIFAAGSYFGLMMAVRIFKDDRGRSVVERGLESYSPRVRQGITLLALYGTMQLITLLAGNAPVVFTPYVTVHQAPAHLINGQCDAPGITGTRYGPCPGTPGFRMPGRTTHLPGRDVEDELRERRG